MPPKNPEEDGTHCIKFGAASDRDRKSLAGMMLGSLDAQRLWLGWRQLFSISTPGSVAESLEIKFAMRVGRDRALADRAGPEHDDDALRFQTQSR